MNREMVKHEKAARGEREGEKEIRVSNRRDKNYFTTNKNTIKTIMRNQKEFCVVCIFIVDAIKGQATSECGVF